MLIEVLLKLLIGVINAKLLELILFENFETKYIENAYYSLSLLFSNFNKTALVNIWLFNGIKIH